MTHKILPLAVLFFLLAWGVRAQEFSQNYWHPGEVHLKDNEREPIRGRIKYNLDSDQVQLTDAGNRMKTFHASQISFIQFDDQLERKTRYFFALPIQNADARYTRMQLFELLLEGPISLLSREKIVQRTQQYFDPFRPFPNTSVAHYVLEETFYLANEQGEIKEVGKRKGQQAWEAFPANAQEDMREYYEKQRINILFRDDMLRFVSYYNEQKKDTNY